MFREVFEPNTEQRVPVRVWARKLAPQALEQLKLVASQPYVTGFVAAMADCHVANGVSVGTVFATEHTVVPRALGNDLGCGMSAIRTNVDANDLDRKTLEKIVATLGRAIPAGSATQKASTHAPDSLFETSLSTKTLEHAREALVPRHLGTLGGGNHFIELDRDSQGNTWLLVHSGSRGLGGAIAQHHEKAALSGTPSVLAGLDTNSEEGAAYLLDLEWALRFARTNRDVMTKRALAVFSDVLGTAVESVDAFDIHHNFASVERWLGRDLIVHRKGAVSTPAGERALVPGSMGTASYVVEGLGCADAFGSCSHGAGRVMSRSEARRRIQKKSFQDSMKKVIYPTSLGNALIEEAPAAYRDIDEVLEDQKDLVKRRTKLEPIAVLKG